MFDKLEVNKFEGLYSSVAPEVIKDGQARDILNFRMEKIGKLVSRDGYIFGLFTHDTTIADSNASVTNNVFANNGGIIGLGEIILEKKWTAIDTDRLMVYAIRAEQAQGFSSALGEQFYGQYEVGGEIPKSNHMAYLFSPVTGRYANTLLSNLDVAAQYNAGNKYDLLDVFHRSIDLTAQGMPTTKPETKLLLAPNKQLPSYGENEYTNGVLGGRHGLEVYDNWINHYVHMSQYRHKLIVSDRNNGDHVIENEADRDSAKKLVNGQWVDSEPGLHIRPNELETFDINKVHLSLRQGEGQENVGVENGMGLYKYVLPKDNYIMSTDNEASALSDPKSYVQDRTIDLNTLKNNFASSNAKFALAYITGSDNVGEPKGYGFKYNNNVSIYSNADSPNEYDNILGTLELEEQEWEDEDGNIVKSKVSDVYVWEDYRLNYKPSSGMDLTSMLLTDASRFFDMTSANARIRELNAIDPLGRNVPLSVWQYRFVWEFGDGAYSAPSALLQAPDAIFSAIPDIEIYDSNNPSLSCTNMLIRPGVTGIASEGYKVERPRKFYEPNQLCVVSQPGLFPAHTELFHTKVLRPDGNGSFTIDLGHGDGLGLQLFKLKEKVFGDAQNRFGIDRGELIKDANGNYTGAAKQSDGTPWGYNNYVDFACIVAVSPVQDVITTKGIFWEGAAVNTAKWGWEDSSMRDDAKYWFKGKSQEPLKKLDSAEKYTSCNNGFLKVPVVMSDENPSLTYYSLFDDEGNLRLAWQGNKTMPALNYNVGASIVFPGFNPQAIAKIDTPLPSREPYYGMSNNTLETKRLTIPEIIYCKSNLPDYGGTLWRDDSCYLFTVPYQITTNAGITVNATIKTKFIVKVVPTGPFNTGGAYSPNYYKAYYIAPNGAHITYTELDSTGVEVEKTWDNIASIPLTKAIDWEFDTNIATMDVFAPIEPWDANTTNTYTFEFLNNNAAFDATATSDSHIAGDIASVIPWNEQTVAILLNQAQTGTDIVASNTRFLSYKNNNGGRPGTIIRASKNSIDSFSNYDSDIDNEAANRLIGQGVLHLNPLKYNEYFAIRSEFDSLAATPQDNAGLSSWISDRLASVIDKRVLFNSGGMHAQSCMERYIFTKEVPGMSIAMVDSNIPGVRSNLDVHVYMPATRFYGIEQLTSYFPASQLFQAPRLGIRIDQADVPKRAKALLIFRTIATHSNDWDPDSFGLVERLEIDRDPAGLAVTYKPDEDPNKQSVGYPGIYFFDDVKDKNLDFSDSPDRYDGLRRALFSRFNIPLNERLYYANFTEVYQSLPPRGMDTGTASGDIVNVNMTYVNASNGKGAPADTTPGKSLSYVYYLVHINEDDKLSPPTEIQSINGNNIKPATGQAVVMYYIPHKYDSTIKETRIYRKTVDDSQGAAIVNSTKLIGRLENNEFGIFVDDFSYLGKELDCTEPNKANYESGIRWSEPYSPDWIKLNNFAEVGSGDGDQITGVVAIAGNLVVFKENSIWRLAVQGDDPPISRTDLVTPDYGCIAPGALLTLDNQVYFLSWDGLKVYDNNIPQSIDTPFAEELKLLLQTVPVGLIRDCQMGYNQGTGEIYLNIPMPAPPDIDNLPNPVNIATTNTVWTEHNIDPDPNAVPLNDTLQIFRPIAPPTTEVKVMSDYYNVDVAMDVENFGSQNVQHRRQQYGHIYIINLKKGYASKFGYPATRILNGQAPRLDVLTTHPLQLMRVYYSNSLGEFRSADISTRPHAFAYNDATKGTSGFYYAGMYIESPYMSIKPTQSIVGTQANMVGGIVLQNKLYADQDVIPAIKYSNQPATIFPIANYVPIRSVFRSKYFTAETEFTLKRVRKVLSNIFAKSHFRVDGTTYHYEGFDSRIDPNSPVITTLLQRYYYPPTDNDVDFTTGSVTPGTNRNIVTFVPSSNGTDWYGKPIKFSVDIYSEKRTQINALEIFWRMIHKYLL